MRLSCHGSLLGNTVCDSLAEFECTLLLLTQQMLASACAQTGDDRGMPRPHKHRHALAELLSAPVSPSGMYAARWGLCPGAPLPASSRLPGPAFMQRTWASVSSGHLLHPLPGDPHLVVP